MGRLLFAWVGFAAAALGQNGAQVVDQQLANVPNLPAYKISPNDLLAVSVYDMPELTRTVRVGPDGLMRLPLLTEPLRVSGLFPFEVERALASELKSEEIVLRPLVTVTLMEYHKRYVSVNGAVHKPVTFQVTGETRLLDALARAEGPTDLAGPVLLLSHSPTADAAATERTISLKELLSGTNNDLNVVLDGDEQIRIPEAKHIYVVGNVRKPGPVPIRDPSDSTVLKLLSVSQGVLPYVSSEAWIYRKEPGTDLPKEIPVPLKKILARKVPDMALQPEDLLYIPENAHERMTLETAKTILTVGSGAVSAVIYAGVR